ncbi:hypothetical protein QUF61_05555 [Candidatus Venteria ishoeyi]|uniref:hypothetical protein n=1 Tax=Candidatus Venteria ishoeyi TaxID=1899563 RepID=UPI0025A525F9|nr:hypothetical protein [Candidatus Venteria ishoeyi]MDM8545938.1 hypothetical protein [Candidatus Venteria ishoeyi]
MKHLAQQLLLSLCLSGFPFYAFALDQNIEDLSGLSQNEFNHIASDLSAAIHYKGLVPAEPLGILGFDVAVSGSASQLQHRELFAKTRTSGSNNKYLVATRLHAHKGLPLGFDVGLSYTLVPNGNLKALGGEVRYAIMQGNAVLPAISIRGSYNKTLDNPVLDLDTIGLELMISKGVLMVTPYAGIGHLWSHVQAKRSPHLNNVKPEQIKAFVGANLNLLGLNANAEIEHTDNVTSYSIKLGLRF